MFFYTYFILWSQTHLGLTSFIYKKVLHVLWQKTPLIKVLILQGMERIQFLVLFTDETY